MTLVITRKLLQDLARAQEDYVMTTDMHLTYLITPVDFSAWDYRGPDWSCLYQMLHTLQVGFNLSFKP